ncbi:MAG: DUF5063 domain-containing protein [Bacteroidetes bacterium CG23_combo_of_CG06-09_8_20_14_all_32_9]|nr:MAG: DUF5063 domain-containing protein [Bacteroidetes bacterium CG23_combo_of_CG06-09_8_20_14_all_32_9]
MLLRNKLQKSKNNFSKKNKSQTQLKMSKSNNFEHPVYSRNVIEFVTVAVEFCNYIEQSKKVEASQFSSAMLKIFPLAYLKASMLPEIVSEEENFNGTFVTEEIYNYIQEIISAKLAENDLVCEVPETVSQNGENTIATLSEIIADIYQDLKNFVMSYRTNKENIMAESLWTCKQNFEQFWGTRLLAAQPAFHKLVYGNTDWQVVKSNERKTANKVYTDNWIISKRQQEWANEF